MVDGIGGCLVVLEVWYYALMKNRFRETKVAEAVELLWYVDKECGWLLKRTTVDEEWRKEGKETRGRGRKRIRGDENAGRRV